MPRILYNLLSVFTLLRLGYDFHLSWNGLDILLDDVIFGHGSICENLFKIDLFESSTSSTFVIDCNMIISSSTWYARLGHIRKDKMTRLAREGLLGPLAKVDLQYVSLVWQARHVESLLVRL